MSESGNPGFHYYFSTYHLARDFVGTAAPFTFFLALAILLFQPVRQLVALAAHEVAPDTSWLIVVTAGVAYLLVAFITGAVANRTALALRDFMEQQSRWRKKVEYTRLYESGRPAIEELYKKYVVETSDIWVNPDSDLFERVDRLCHLFKLYNPSGFQHVYRDYSFVFMYRQVAIYLLLFLGICVAQARWAESIALSAGVFIIVLAIKAGVREAVNGEYQFIFATASWLERQENARRGEEGVGAYKVAKFTA